MADTTQPVETVTPEAPSNDANPAATPTVNATDNAEVERLKKEAQQAQMRANQLENELKKKSDAEEAEKRKRLEEQNEFKDLYEQEKAKREAIENERLEAEAKEEKRLAEETIFAEFSQEAIEVAKEAGLSLKDDSDEAKADFKQRLQKISDKVVSQATVTPNNPGNTEQPNAERQQLVQEMRNGSKEARDKVISGLPVLDQMRQQAGYTPQQ